MSDLRPKCLKLNLHAKIAQFVKRFMLTLTI